MFEKFYVNSMMLLVISLFPYTVNSDLVARDTMNFAVNEVLVSWDENGKYRLRLNDNVTKSYEISTVKKTINGTIYIKSDTIIVNGLNVLVNYKTKYKNTNLSRLSTGVKVRVKGYLVDGKNMLASSIEKIDFNNQQSDQDMRIIAALLLLKYKN